MKPANNRFDVYEFGEVDDVVQLSAQRLANKYNNNNNTNIINNNSNSSVKRKKAKKSSPVTKYSFLQSFSQGTESKQKELIINRLEIEDDGDTIEEVLSCFNQIASSGSSNCVPATCTESDRVTINIDDDDGNDDIKSSVSTASSKLAGNEGAIEEQALEHHFGGCKIDDDVVVWPNYIIYGDMYSTSCQITFSSSSIKVECSAVCGNKISFDIEWNLDDIEKIESQWCDQFQTAAVNLLLKLRDEEVAEDANTSRGIAEFRFAVNDPHWHKQEEAIKMLNMQFVTKWVIVYDIDSRTEDYRLDKKNSFIPEHNLPILEESEKEIVYPRGEPDAVSVSMRDIELLKPETFVNDTIIDFYIKYLENKIKHEEKHRFYFFNCFFFRKLADLDKDPSKAGDGRAAFHRVRKWTRKVDLFEKDYIFIPVNFSLHWSLIVICHPGEAANFEGGDLQKLFKVPCILHMDSIKGSHRGLKNLFQSYLLEEWKERGNVSEDVSSKFLNLQFLSLELPQQGNSFDCGIFLLHYVELFLEQAPACFNPFKTKKRLKFLKKNWFLPVDASRKRAYIKDLITQIAEHYDKSTHPALPDSDKHFSSDVLILEERGTKTELPEEKCRSFNVEFCDTNYPSYYSDEESGSEPLIKTPYRGAIACSKEHDSCGRLIYENRSIGQKVLRDRLKNFMTPIEEIEETSEQQAKLGGFSSSLKTEINENHTSDLFGPNFLETTESPSTSSAELVSCIVEDSEEDDSVIDVTDQENYIFGQRKVNNTFKIEGGSVDCIIVPAVDSNAVIERDERLGSKRRSPRRLERVGRRLRSSSKEVHELHLCE